MMKSKETVSSGIAHNVLATGTFLSGKIKADESFRIDGKIEGDIECNGKVIVGPQAEITGNIQCQNIDLFGKIEGNISASETVSLKASVNFTGEITTKFIEIETGAIFNGSCKMING